MRHFLKAGLFSLFLLLSVISSSFAQTNEEGPYVQIRLIPEGPITPGGEVTVAIEQNIAPGWHTYWKNPGDSGAAPRVKWTLPEGFSAGEIEWPVPHKLPIGPLLNYGYENNVVLLQKIKAPRDLPEGAIALKADIDILVCKEICIPESGTYDLVLNDSHAPEPKKFFDDVRSKLPSGTSSDASYYEEDGYFVIEKPIDWSQRAAHYDYIPEDWGVVENAAPTDIKEKDGKLIIRQKRGERALSELSEIRGLLLWGASPQEPQNAYVFTAVPGNPPALKPATSAPSQPLLYILIIAVLGGLILNLMPCVFPVLSIKALGLVKVAEKSSSLARLHGFCYTAGVILSFLVIAAILIGLKEAGAQVGWGFQLQNPQIIAALAYLFFILGLNFSGVFEIAGHFGNVGNKLTQGGTPAHSFFTGVLATLVATPCTAPFMGAALGFALVQPALVGLLVFAALGLGLALPYLALSIVPALQKILPRPGAWMETFRQLLAFPMYASVAWLVWVVSQQAGSMGVLLTLLGIILIAFGIWLLRHMPRAKSWNYFVRILAIISFIAALIILPDASRKTETHAAVTEGFSEAYSPARLEELLKGSHPVFVEMTAAWCITCKVNHSVAIDIEATRRLFAENNVEYLIGDWTSQDPVITEYLSRFGRNGVPIYVYYGPRDANGTRPEPVILPQILTPGIVARAVTGI